MRIKQGQAERMITTMAAVGALLGATAGQAAGQCALTSRELRIPGSSFHTIATVVFDDGSGPAIYAGNSDNVTVHRRGLDGVWRRTTEAPNTGGADAHAFLLDTDAQGQSSLLVAARHVLRWSSSLQRWEAISPTAPRQIDAITRHTDASGSFLVASGAFGAQGVAWRLNGSAWERMGTTTNAFVQSLVSLDPDGPGPIQATLYAASRSGVLRWDGTEWQVVPGLSDWLKTATAFDDGTGSQLYVSGHLLTTSSVRYSQIVRWTGTDWNGVDDRWNSPAIYKVAFGFAQFDDGSGRGRELYAVTSDSLMRLRDGRFSTVLNLSLGYDRSFLQIGLGVGRLAPSGPEVLFIPQSNGVLAVTGCNACRADVNYDGVAAVTDVLQFINAWFAGLPEADFNRSGALSVDDVLAFIGAWTGGC